MKSVKFKLIFSIILVGLCIWAVWPPSEKINRGLDISGGMYLVLEVKTEEAIKNMVKQDGERLKKVFEDQQITLEKEAVSVSGFSIFVKAIPKDFQDKAREAAQTYFTDYKVAGDSTLSLVLTDKFVSESEKKILESAKDTLRRRVDEFGLQERSIYEANTKNHIMVELPHISSPNEAKELLRKTASLELKLVHDAHSSPMTMEQVRTTFPGGLAPEGYDIVKYRPENPKEAGKVEDLFMVVKSAPVITGRHLTRAEPSMSTGLSRAGAVVHFTLNSEGAARFGEATEANIGHPLAILLDNVVISAPTIQGRISESGEISGVGTLEQAKLLSTALNSGALPAPIEIASQVIVQASLGEAFMVMVVYAGLLGFGLIIAFMLFYYRLSGFNAIICLIINLIVLMGFVGYFKATLTLPGIAGIILTIGMGVDTNVLIYERIREELRIGKTVGAAVEAGFNRAFLTIIDTHLCSIISGIVLFQLGTGPIRGFAVTLIAGLVANLFSSVFVCRTVFQIVLQNFRVKKLSI